MREDSLPVSEDPSVRPLTALNLILEEKLDHALLLLEATRSAVRLVPGDIIPHDRLPIMPEGTKLADFEKAWQAAYDGADAPTRARMDNLTEWLRNLHTFEPAPPRFGGRPMDPMPPRRPPDPDPPTRPRSPAAPTLTERALTWVLRQILRVAFRRTSPFKR